MGRTTVRLVGDRGEGGGVRGSGAWYARRTGGVPSSVLFYFVFCFVFFAFLGSHGGAVFSSWWLGF
jgi:hypothetical protein